ncbi:6,7-dimethyl-8-ribityllumazine synthase [Loigolactobacillus coryniformis]|jgi:6,7-dimethyl-8-ribityllumazine synthase|uniref:6,7-dimethyl-8-ribityllumazine synthase n=1 Tax=Loigolactobacillus coryniformis subsp. torquens DSM 20004 = KCTC 3535 TaxID=1423822 RepID=A0A2D1KPP5_9LACO|nr:6,7-dimethyl-8-ribityllumazine synthase [Loigolactobacillus coryniformis]ATO44114.1 6,7-dimethyl-8-ribityllumazine synthase [Loigolactobacillus coryniformis subsp. torquens DSM 20004 = KCTC 3535]KRK77012.1 6,7-dimethyl-8-ribityllumazine synthase [Loigolactobacillus coryniformis subsp. torquens DSM 20004 = KCTC 3535]MCL5458515.1 6,7-dimethyl-8-ribityllumazine synthase [Loigolactobacillus coryniformis]
MTEICGTVNGQTAKVGIVAAKFNSLVTTKLVNGALLELKKYEVVPQNITTIWVPGALELARVIKQLTASGQVDGIIALGAVVRGETSHYELVCRETAVGLADISLHGPIPVMFGVLTTDNMDQAINRAGGKSGNKGADCASGLLEMLSVERQIKAL